MDVDVQRLKSMDPRLRGDDDFKHPDDAFRHVVKASHPTREAALH
jgi:hypothetical protein